MTRVSSNEGFRILIGVVSLVVILTIWLWLADRFFDGSTQDFSPRYERGFLAFAEQVAASLFTPAWLIWESAFSGWRARSQALDRGPLFVLCIFQLWPAFVLAVRPWQRLSLLTRRVILCYCGLCLLATVTGFVVLYRSWDRIFGP